MDPLFVESYVDKLKKLSAQKAEEHSGTNSEWQDIVGELTEFLNEERKGGPYPPLESKRVAMLVSYIWTKGGATDLRKFRDDVRSKGAWFFWWIVKPKRDPGQIIK
jgi:hypothetical protein